jgi:transcriptional regulator with XRE-family HTH domain
MSYNWDPQKFRQLLEDRGMTQEDLAELTGYSTGTISRTLKLHQPLNDQFAARVAIALGISLQYLLHDEPVTV